MTSNLSNEKSEGPPVPPSHKSQVKQLIQESIERTMRRRREGATQQEGKLQADESADRVLSSDSENDDNDDDSSDPLLVAPAPNRKQVSFLQKKSSMKKNCQLSFSSTRISQTLRRWLRFYVKFLQASPMHQDRLLKVLQWTAWLVSVALERRSSSNNNNNKSSQIIWQKLSIDLSFARYATRLLEWPTALQAAITGGWTHTQSSTAKSSLFRWIGRCLSWSMVGYYPTEHAAYLLWMRPAGLQTPDSSWRAAQLSAWSCRCWLVYIVADLVQSVVLLRQQQQRTVPADDDDDDDDDVMEEKAMQNFSARQHWRLQAMRNGLFLLPCIHWSLPNWDTKPWLSTKTVNGLMWMEAMVCLYQTALALPHEEEDET